MTVAAERTETGAHGLRDRTWRRFFRGPDPTLLEELYVPALSAAVRYDRCCAYFSSSVLSAAARGFGPLIASLRELGDQAPRPAVRMVVNEELDEADVRALAEKGDTASLERALQRRFKNPTEALQRQRLGMLGWLVKQGLLEVRVGVMRRGQGILHAKFGLVYDDADDCLVFSGSGNESAQGLVANYEHLEVSTSWSDPERQQEFADQFALLWENRHPDVLTLSLPEALRLRLVKLAPAQPPVVEPGVSLARQRAAMLWRYLLESPYFPEGGPVCDATAAVELWPHQRRVVADTAEAWPAGRLLCDEVGMGKTIEAILAVRRLLAGRGARRVLFLLPAGLLRQWQAELREKGGLLVPRYEPARGLVWPDERPEAVGGLAEALRQDLLLLSRETARLPANRVHLLQATPWDLVLLDEAHAARRREQEEGEYNAATLLLELLRLLQLRRQARGIVLLSATPMQIQPWEPWDLLAVLGEGGPWLAEFAAVRGYYGAVRGLETGHLDQPTASRAARLIDADPEFLPPPQGAGAAQPSTAHRLLFALQGQRPVLARWLRGGAPLGRRMHRNTRDTLRQYHRLGLIDRPPARRAIRDVVFDYQDADERVLYDAVGAYIDRRFDELEREAPGKGFVMTIYRRRASSSPLALRRSLERRAEGLRRVTANHAREDFLAEQDIPETILDDELPEGDEVPRVSAALPTSPTVAREELEEVRRVLDQIAGLNNQDSKRDCFFDELRRVTDDGRAVLVFSEYRDTVEYLRDALVGHYGAKLATYSGAGGQVWDGQAWQPVTKDAITQLLRTGALRAVVCTDAASEGLNLQAAGALINYDLPWNPSRVEQRIGRIDRIGQERPTVGIVNLFLRDSVDERVYRALRQRCGVFEHFVGAMQPVLARARQMLMGWEVANLAVLDDEARRVQAEPLLTETYLESQAEAGAAATPAVSRTHLEAAVDRLADGAGLRVKWSGNGDRMEVSGRGFPKGTYTTRVEVLEQDRQARLLSPFDADLRRLVGSLERAGERPPLVVAAVEQAPFRTAVARWVDADGSRPVDTFDELVKLVDAWDGRYPEPGAWLAAQAAARAEAVLFVQTVRQRADLRERQGVERQVEAARRRLVLELGRFLLSAEPGATDLNQALYQRMRRGDATAQRLRRCYERLGDYPVWDPEDLAELRHFAQTQHASRREARLFGSELDAALGDPRWAAVEALAGAWAN